MFKKKPNIKPLAPLRSSDRRKTADQIISDLNIGDIQFQAPSSIPATSSSLPANNTKNDALETTGTAAANNDAEGEDPEAKAKAIAVARQTALRSALLPENALSARFTTTAGPNLKQVSGSVYVGSYPGEEQRVLWARTDEKMFPTVYTLWHNPGILPLLHTPSIVVKKIQGGADLMTPGLAGGPPFPHGAKRGALVAIASAECPTVPVAVGVCEIDVSSLGRVQGSKGHAVQILHWAGDELWAWSASGKPGGPMPGHLEGWIAGRKASEDDDDDDHSDDDKAVTKGVSGIRIDDEEDKVENCNGDESGKDGGVSFVNSRNGKNGVSARSGKSKVAQVGEEDEEEEDGDGRSAAPDEEKEREMTTKEIDDAFHKAFLYGVYHFKNTNKETPNYGLQLPLSQSFILSSLVLPFLPAFTLTQASCLQIKKTSWRNIKKFIKSLDKEKLVKAKDKDGNEVAIWDIDFQHQQFIGFSPYRLPKKETATGTSQGRGGKATTATSSSSGAPSGSGGPIGQTLRRIELFKPKEKLSPIFNGGNTSGTNNASSKNNVNKRTVFTASELRPIITSYIEREKLINEKNKRLVKLDPILANAVFDDKLPTDKEVIAAGAVARDALFDRIQRSCTQHWIILRNEETLDMLATSMKPRSGAPPNINITLETRSGNKTVTKVSGLENYHIAPQPLADELRKSCASSTSVEKLVGASPKTLKVPVMELMVQGPQQAAVLKALEKRGVKKQWVDVVDKTKGKKKG